MIALREQLDKRGCYIGNTYLSLCGVSLSKMAVLPPVNLQNTLSLDAGCTANRRKLPYEVDPESFVTVCNNMLRYRIRKMFARNFCETLSHTEKTIVAIHEISIGLARKLAQMYPRTPKELLYTESLTPRLNNRAKQKHQTYQSGRIRISSKNIESKRRAIFRAPAELKNFRINH